MINGLNKTAIDAIMERMKADPTVGDNVSVVVTAIWKRGVIFHTDSELVCFPPPEIAKEVGYPSMNSYCPLVAAGCFSLIYMLHAAERDVSFESFQTRQKHNVDFSCFYKTSAAGTNPWEDGVTLDIEMKCPQSQDVLIDLGKIADAHCPSVEIMRREFPVEVTKVTGTYAELKGKTVYYDMDKYNALSKQVGPIIVKQHAKGRWYCKNECKKYPDALMTFEFKHDGNSVLVLSHDKPMASGKYATPVQACFFGGLSTYMHTFAVRLYTRGYIIKSIKGTLKTRMNNRMVMAVDLDKYIFPGSAFIELEVESNAPDEALYEAQHEADEMSPAFMNWRNSIPMQLNLAKASGTFESIGKLFKRK